jgi:hypothetical protein
MPEYTEHERAALHAKARQQIRFISLARSVEAVDNRRCLAIGYLLGLTEAEAVSAEQVEQLNNELHDTATARFDALFQENLPPRSRRLRVPWTKWSPHDAAWRAAHAAIEVTGECDAKCGRPATTWFHSTSCATCGQPACIAVLQSDYDAATAAFLREDPR